MGAIVVTLVAVVIVLVFGVVVAAGRLFRALSQLRTAVDRSNERIQPVITELNEAGQVTTIELTELQASVQDLGKRAKTGLTASPSGQ
jgi:predicted PurR-regulated permease PerM